MESKVSSKIETRRNAIRNIVQCGLFAAIIAVLTLITIPLPSGVPITLQTFAVALCGYSLGVKRGAVATGVYIALGAVGLPVFSGMKGGVAVLAGATGGYIYGFLGLAALCGLGAFIKLKSESKPAKSLNIAIAILLGLAGLAVCHICGTLQFGALTGRGFVEAALVASVPYLLKDIVSVVIAYLLGSQIKRRLIK
ncbi:MAG: biotin transporter BioY [Clostridiales bacterium]|nr:biotin transporter BioY [Clostridiales bacterium]